MERPKAYEIVLSNKTILKVDADEIEKVVHGISSGGSVIVRQGIFNPSFYVAIREDNERIKKYFSAIAEIGRQNEQAEKYGAGKVKSIPEFQKLGDIFSGVKLLN